MINMPKRKKRRKRESIFSGLEIPVHSSKCRHQLFLIYDPIEKILFCARCGKKINAKDLKEELHINSIL